MVATDKTFRFGEWRVSPAANRVEKGSLTKQIEPRAMDVLVALCEADGRIVHADELLAQCWGRTDSSDNPVHKVLTQLRQALGDKATAPAYIETVRKRGYRTVAQVTRETAAGEPQADWRHRSPFRGLQAFHEEYAGVFFGREELTLRVVASAERQLDTGLELLLLLGPSGSGKTSVVRAGVLPALAAEVRRGKLQLLASTTLDLVEIGEQTLFTALASVLLDLEWLDQPIFRPDSAASLGFRLEHQSDGVLAQLRAFLDQQSHLDSRPRLGLFIDRLEALFDGRVAREAARDAFLMLLGRLAASGTMLVITACRNDFYPWVVRHPILMQGKQDGSHIDVEPPGFSGIAQIIRMSASAAGLSFSTDPVTHARLDDVLCETAAASPDALPLLQYCLQELYQLRTEQRELSFEAFRTVGGLEGAIAQRAEELVAGFTREQQATLPRVMSLVAVVHAGASGVVSQRAPWAALRGNAERHVVAAFVDSRLFVSDLVGEVPGFAVAHEALLRHWPRMRDWIELHRGELLVHRRLSEWAERWRDEGFRKDLLLSGGRQIDEMTALQRSGLFDLKDEEIRLIRESARRARHLHGLRLAALCAIVVLAAVAVGLWFNATGARRLAEQRRAEAEGLMSYMLGDFADKLRPLGRLELLDGISTKALAYLAQTSAGDRVGLTQRVKTLQVIGEVRRARGDLPAAMRALSEAQSILQGMASAAPRDIVILRNLGDNAYWMGQISKDQGDFPRASAHWHLYLAMSDKLHAIEPAKTEWWVEQSYAHNNLGSLAAMRGDAQTAASEFAESIALKLRSLDRMPGSTAVLAELADSYSWLASARGALGDLAAAKQLNEKEMAITEQLRQAAPRDALWINRKVRALQHRAANFQIEGDDRSALADMREARKLFTGIANEDPGNRAWKSDLAYLQLEEQALLERTGDSGVLPVLKKILAVQLSLHEQDPANADWHRRVALIRLQLAKAYLAAGASAQARAENAAASVALRTLVVATPWDVKVRLGLANALLEQAGLLGHAGDEPGRTASCLAAHDILHTDAPASFNYQFLAPWVRANLCLDRRDTAAQAAQRLQQIGYRDSEFLGSSYHPTCKGTTCLP